MKKIILKLLFCITYCNYIHALYYIIKKPFNIIHVIAIDPTQYTLRIEQSNQGLQPIVTFTNNNRDDYVINGSFFKYEGGIPTYALKINNIHYKISNYPHGALGLTDGKQSIIDRIKQNVTLTINTLSYQIDTIDYSSSDNQIELFTHSNYLKSKNSNKYYIILPEIVYDQIDGEKIHFFTNEWIVGIPKSLIADNQTIYSWQIHTQYEPDNTENTAIWNNSDTVMMGNPLLMKDGKLELDWTSECKSPLFIDYPHARTLIGYKKNGTIIMVTAEDTITPSIKIIQQLFNPIINIHPSITNHYSMGMSLKNAAKLMLSLDCYAALNLDGGSSTNLIVNQKQIMGNQKPIANVIIAEQTLITH